VGGKNFPQTPCKVALGVWAAGTSSQAEGTVTWAGGLTDFDDAPFTMYVESVTIKNYNPGLNYKWMDQTGDFTSIDVLNSTTETNSTSTATTSKTERSGLANPDGVVSGNKSTSSSTAASGSTTASGSTAASGSATSFSQDKSGAMGLSAGGSWVGCGTTLVLSLVFGFALV
jgi:hypothetical protein